MIKAKRTAFNMTADRAVSRLKLKLMKERIIGYEGGHSVTGRPL